MEQEAQLRIELSVGAKIVEGPVELMPEDREETAIASFWKPRFFSMGSKVDAIENVSLFSGCGSRVEGEAGASYAAVTGDATVINSGIEMMVTNTNVSRLAMRERE